jgi:Aminoglycoside-2''-adenylyltransferase
MDTERSRRQLGMIADIVALSGQLGVQLWLRGGWAMDFPPGQVTRDHVDIDRFGWIDDAPALEAALHADGYQTIPGPPPDQQLDVTKDGEELSFTWLAQGAHGQVMVAGGRFA